MSKNSRVAGHELQAEGAAYQKSAFHRYPYRVRTIGTGGLGFGLCSCGARSGVLNSGNLRKAWHRNHKAEVAP